MNGEPTHNVAPPLSKEQALLLSSLQGMESDFIALCNKIGRSRELSLAVTNMEQASMWAVRHIMADYAK